MPPRGVTATRSGLPMVRVPVLSTTSVSIFSSVSRASALRMRMPCWAPLPVPVRSEEHTSELQSLMRISYAVFCLKKKTTNHYIAYHIFVHQIQRSDSTDSLLITIHRHGEITIQVAPHNTHTYTIST